MPISSKTPTSLFLLLLLPACAGNGPPPPPPQVSIGQADTRALSFTEVERMPDQEYWGYVYEGFARISEGHAWGEHLLSFMKENATYATKKEIESTNARRSGNLFFVSVLPPSAQGTEYFFSDAYHALMIPKIPIDQIVAGAILAHELQHAYDRSMSEDTQEISFTNNSFIEMQAYELAIDLLDNYLDGRFRETIQQVLDAKEYDRKGTGKLLYLPNRRGRARLDALFGYPSPWENLLREPLYAMALSYAAAEGSPLERTYATAIYKGFGFLALRDRYEHVGTDRAAEPGEVYPSPIGGTVLRLEGALEGQEKLRGLVIQGAGADSGAVLRVLGIDPAVSDGDQVALGEPLGQVQDLRREAPPRDPWVHVELYRMGERQEPGSIEEWAWPGHHAARTNKAGRSYRRRDLTEKGFEAELDRDYEKAIAHFEEALDSPIPEVPATPIMHAIARSHAALGHYEEAARIMERMVRVLEAELAYSKGGVPTVEIGTEAQISDETLAEVWLIHMRANLEAYRGGRDTVYIY